VYADGALLRSIAVDQRARGQRLGSQLTRSALAFAETLGVPAVFLLTTTAEGFFPRFGFQRIDRGQVPKSLLESIEFQSACPTTATVMRRALVQER
jgi:amino-acid N-acetyltransferase